MPSPTFRFPVRTLTNPVAAPVVRVMFPDVAVAKAKVPEVTEREAEERPVAEIEPEVEVKESAPVVIVRPFEAVKVWVEVREPALVVVTPVLPRVKAEALVPPIVIDPLLPAVPPLAAPAAPASKLNEPPAPAVPVAPEDAPPVPPERKIAPPAPDVVAPTLALPAAPESDNAPPAAPAVVESAILTVWAFSFSKERVVGKMERVSVTALPSNVLPLTVKSEAVTMAPVVPETVKLLVSTAIPPSRLTRVVVVAPLPVTVARVEELAIVITPADPVVVISVPAVKVNVPPWETV